MLNSELVYPQDREDHTQFSGAFFTQILIFWQERMIWMMEEGHVWGIRSLRSFPLDGKYLQLKYTLSIPEKISICLIRGRMESLGNVTFLFCSRPQVRDG